MVELLFFITFAFVLMLTGVTFVGIFCAVFFGIVAMALGGLLAMLFNMLPWLVLIALVIWLCKGKDKTAHHCRNICNQRFRRP